MEERAEGRGDCDKSEVKAADKCKHRASIDVIVGLIVVVGDAAICQTEGRR
jgi:hypothetical protein